MKSVWQNWPKPCELRVRNSDAELGIRRREPAFITRPYAQIESKCRVVGTASEKGFFHVLTRKQQGLTLLKRLATSWVMTIEASPRAIPLDIWFMQTDPTEEARLRRAFLVMAGLPKHGTRWARAQKSHAGESLTREERHCSSNEVKC